VAACAAASAAGGLGESATDLVHAQRAEFRDRFGQKRLRNRAKIVEADDTFGWHTVLGADLNFGLDTHNAIGNLIRSDLILIDDVGLLTVSADAADALFRVVDAAYEKRSIAISSNIHPSGFDELMPKTIATATVDRLLHHAHVIITDGQDSYRLAQATAGKGVKPLT
jgi:hypothetical protein